MSGSTSPRHRARLTIAEAAVVVARRHEAELIVYGDTSVLDEIGRLAQMTPTHPLNRHHRILNALDRSLFWAKRWGRWSVTNRRVRGFQLTEMGRALVLIDPTPPESR